MEEKKLSKRVMKTRREIHQALFILLQTKPYSKITIQDIIDQAEIGRSTFYLHFETKDELLLSLISNIFESFSKDFISDGNNSYVLPIKEIFIHVQENHRILYGIYQSDSGDVLFAKIQEYWNNVLAQQILMHPELNRKTDVPVELYVNHITGSVINMLKWWLSSKARYTPDEMQKYWELVIG